MFACVRGLSRRRELPDQRWRGVCVGIGLHANVSKNVAFLILLTRLIGCSAWRGRALSRCGSITRSHVRVKAGIPE